MVLHDIDVSNALVDFIHTNCITNMVLGSSNRNALTRSLSLSLSFVHACLFSNDFVLQQRCLPCFTSRQYLFCHHICYLEKTFELWSALPSGTLWGLLRRFEGDIPFLSPLLMILFIFWPSPGRLKMLMCQLWCANLHRPSAQCMWHQKGKFTTAGQPANLPHLIAQLVPSDHLNQGFQWILHNQMFCIGKSWNYGD